jgi:hypothetical protein
VKKCIHSYCTYHVLGDAGTLNENYGRYIGSFKGLAHGVRGTVYAVDENTLYVRGFFYDGIGPSKYPQLYVLFHKIVPVTLYYHMQLFVGRNAYVAITFYRFQRFRTVRCKECYEPYTEYTCARCG